MFLITMCSFVGALFIPSMFHSDILFSWNFGFLHQNRTVNLLTLSSNSFPCWYKCRYITNDDVVELKGKVASEISSADELTLTELMFNGTFKDIKIEDMVALLSCLVWQEKLQDTLKPREELELLFIRLQDTARRVAKVQLECKVAFHLLYLFFMHLVFAKPITFCFAEVMN